MIKKRTRSGGLAGIISFSLTGLFLGALVLPFIDLQTAPPDTIAGAVYVLDGDSLKVAGREIRLTGIDAPEFAQNCRRSGDEYPCGRRARDHLAAIVGNARIRCHVVAADQYRRALGECYAGDTFINGTMVLDGWAVGYRRFEEEETQARRARRGLWQGTFERPKVWRSKHGRNNASRK